MSNNNDNKVEMSKCDLMEFKINGINKLVSTTKNLFTNLDELLQVVIHSNTLNDIKSFSRDKKKENEAAYMLLRQMKERKSMNK